MAGFLPRDAILYLNLCVREATGKDKMSWENIHQAERAYSNERLLALRDEWKDPYLGIEKLFEKFQRKPAKLSETCPVPAYPRVYFSRYGTLLLGSATALSKSSRVDCKKASLPVESSVMAEIIKVRLRGVRGSSMMRIRNVDVLSAVTAFG